MKPPVDGAKSRGFEDLKAWQLAHQFMLKCHALSKKFPPEEHYDLVQQIRRSSKSVGNNIAEGYGRFHYLEKMRYCYIARGELNEALSELIQARDLQYISLAEFEDAYNLGREAEKALNGYIDYVDRLREGHVLFGSRLLQDAGEVLPASKK